MTTHQKKPNRRAFLATAATTAAGISLGVPTFSAPMINPVRGANDKIRMGFIGVGNRGTQLMRNFMDNEDVEVAALCDVYKPYTLRDNSLVHAEIAKSGKVPNMKESFGKDVKLYSDFRELLDQKDIDAVCIATPDHWHAVQTIQAIQAGKDVYVEKPLTITLKEGRAMVNAQKQSDRVVAVGLNRRGSSVYRQLAGKVEDKIGKVTFAKAFRVSNMYPNGIGNLQPTDPPKDFDWDMWLGPRPSRPYQYNIAPYYFRWWKEYSSQMGNWGVHYMDAIRWMVGETAPVAITAHGGKYVLNDDRNIPDTMEVLFEFKSGMIVQFGIHEAGTIPGIEPGEVMLSGTKGTISIDQNGYQIKPARSGQFQDWDKLIEAEDYNLQSDSQHGDLGIKENSTGVLIRNFLDCVKSRETPWCTLEDGHRSTSFAHLANIALETGGRIEWDPYKEQITNNEAANKMLHYEYRSPWKLS